MNDLLLLRLCIIAAEAAKLAVDFGFADLNVLLPHLALEILADFIARLARADDLEPVAARPLGGGTSTICPVCSL